MYRELLKKTGTYSLAGLATRAASFLMLPLYTRFLTPADYGVMELLDLTTSLIGLLFGARAGSALFYFYFSASTQREKDDSISNVFVFSIGLALLMLAITIPCASVISTIVFGTTQYGPYFRLLFFGFACSIPMEVGYCCLRAFNQPELYVRLAVLQTVAAAALNALFLVRFQMGVRSMLTTGIITSAALTIFLAQYTLSSRGISIKPKKIFQLFRYCFPLGLSGLAVFIIHYGDRAFLRRSVSLSDLGVYALAYKFGMLIAFIHAPFHLHWTSQVCKIVKLPHGEKIYIRSTTVLIATLFFAALLLAFLSEPLVRIMAGQAFAGAGALVPWIGCAYVLRAIGAHLQGVFTVEGRPGLELRVNALGSLVCLGAYATLIPRFQMWGAVAATLLGFGVILAYSYWEAQRLRRFPFEYARLLRLCLVGGLAATVFYAVRPANLFLQGGVGLLCAAIYPVGIWSFCLDAEERRQLWQHARRAFSRVIAEDVEAAPV
jgi:O-antigen/teichoic acid export membrane protein